MDFIEYEELFKSKKVTRSKALTDALLRNLAILQGDKVNDYDKKLAQANIEKIKSYSLNDPKMKPLDPKTVMAPVPGTGKPMALQQPPVAPKPVAEAPVAAPKESKKKLGYDPLFAHYNITPETWKQLPSHMKQHTHDFHSEVLGGKHPEYSQKMNLASVKKSVEKLNTLVKTIKERLQESDI
jgi:hypothetical protein